jgi:predicted nucleic acid-binding protein
MKVVLEASAALAAVLGGRSAPAVLDVLDAAAVVLAPELYASEVTSGLWNVIAKQLTVDQASEKLDAVLRLVDQYHPIAGLTQEVLREASARRHSVYDLCYAVLARREGAALLTLDVRLRKLLPSLGIQAYP